MFTAGASVSWPTLEPRVARARLDMFKKSGKNSTSAASLGGGQAVHFDWEQRDFTQTIQLGMTQLTAFLNEFGAFAM